MRFRGRNTAEPKAQNASPLRRAFEAHEGLDRPRTLELLGGVAPYGMDASRWQNYQKYAKEHPAIAEIVSVDIGETSDTGELVLTLVGVDGNRVSLWCLARAGFANSHSVRSVTSR